MFKYIEVVDLDAVEVVFVSKRIDTVPKSQVLAVQPIHLLILHFHF